MRRVALSLILVSLLVGCPRDEFEANPNLHPSNTAVKDYFPFVKGATWTYVSKDRDPIFDSTMSVTMLQVVASGDQTIAQVRKTYRYRVLEPHVEDWTFVKDPGGIKAKNTSGGVDPIVTFPLSIGSRIVELATTSVRTDELGEIRHIDSDVNQTIATESTAWSTDCISATRAYNWSLVSAQATWSWKNTSTIVFAPHIGPVRRSFGSSGDQWQEELATFSIPSINR